MVTIYQLTWCNVWWFETSWNGISENVEQTLPKYVGCNRFQLNSTWRSVVNGWLNCSDVAIQGELEKDCYRVTVLAPSIILGLWPH